MIYIADDKNYPIIEKISGFYYQKAVNHRKKYEFQKVK